MSVHDPTSEDGATEGGYEPGSLSVALADLADTMPDDPYRVDAVHARTRRLRARRRAGRAAAVAVAGAAIVAAIVAVHPGPIHVSTIPAAPATTASMVTRPCTAVLAASPAPSRTPPKTSNAPVSADTASVVAADTAKEAVAAAAATSQASTGLRGVKGFGTIVSATDTSVTITLDEPRADQPTQVTATISPDAAYVDGDTAVGARPPLHPTDHVAFAVTQANDGGYQLIYLQVHPARTGPESGQAVKIARADADSSYVKGVARVISVQAGSLALKLSDGPLANRVVTVTTTAHTVYSVGDQTCVEPQLTAGMTVGVLLIRGSDGTYVARHVSLIETPAPSS